MRQPQLQDFDEDDGYGPDYEAYCDMMDTYADEQRDEQLEKEFTEKEQDKEQDKEEDK